MRFLFVFVGIICLTCVNAFAQNEPLLIDDFEFYESEEELKMGWFVNEGPESEFAQIGLSTDSGIDGSQALTALLDINKGEGFGGIRLQIPSRQGFSPLALDVLDFGIDQVFTGNEIALRFLIRSIPEGVSVFVQPQDVFGTAQGGVSLDPATTEYEERVVLTEVIQADNGFGSGPDSIYGLVFWLSPPEEFSTAEIFVDDVQWLRSLETTSVDNWEIH